MSIKYMKDCEDVCCAIKTFTERCEKVERHKKRHEKRVNNRQRLYERRMLLGRIK